MMLMHTENNASPFLLRKGQNFTNNADAHKKKQESLSPEKKTYLKRIILLYNTNIASHSLLIRKLKY